MILAIIFRPEIVRAHVSAGARLNRLNHYAHQVILIVPVDLVCV